MTTVKNLTTSISQRPLSARIGYRDAESRKLLGCGLGCVRRLVIRAGKGKMTVSSKLCCVGDALDWKEGLCK